MTARYHHSTKTHNLIKSIKEALARLEHTNLSEIMPLDPKYLDPQTIATIDKLHNVRPFLSAPLSKEPIETIQLVEIDLSLYKDGPEHLQDRTRLAATLEQALTTHGFFKLVNHGIPHETLERMKSIGQGIFELDEDTKQAYFGGKRPHPQEASRNLGPIRGAGFKPRGFWEYVKGTRDNIEFFNVRNFLHDDIFFDTPQPEFVKYHLAEISAYFKYLHTEVLRKVLGLIDLIFEIPEGYIYSHFFKPVENNLSRSGDGFGRFLLYHPVDEDYKERVNNTWMRGHTDSSALTFIISQSILSLQIQQHSTGKWQYVSHTPDALIVNIGDAFKYLSGDYFKPSVHRVTTPPPDQSQYERNTVIYFSNPSLETYIDPLSLNLPKLERLGRNKPGDPRLTFLDWDEEKAKFLNSTESRKTQVTMFGKPTLIGFVEGREAAQVR